MIKLYYPESHYDKSKRGLLFPLLKPFIKKESFTDVERMEIYGLSERDFQFTQILEDADLVILTMAWNYYVKTEKIDDALAFINECADKGKKVLTWNAGDHGVAIPHQSNLIVFRESGYRSKFSSNEHSLPSFISDPLKKYYKTQNPFIIPYSPKPLIGFCGQAQRSKARAAKEVAQIFWRNLKFYAAKSKEEPEELLSTTYLRASVLNSLEGSDLVTTDFILRDKYRAGVTQNKDVHRSTMEFYDNIKTSPYVLCVRGAGNFSVRFYETLAMGRIPVFINTDSSLPFYNGIDWNKHVLWIEYKDRDKVAEKLIYFHKSLSPENFIDLQLSNRKLWEDKLTLKGFFKEYLQVQSGSF